MQQPIGQSTRDNPVRIFNQRSLELRRTPATPNVMRQMVLKAREKQSKLAARGEKVSMRELLTDSFSRFAKFAWRRPKQAMVYLGTSLVPIPGLGFLGKLLAGGPARRQEEQLLKLAAKNAVEKQRGWRSWRIVTAFNRSFGKGGQPVRQPQQPPRPRVVYAFDPKRNAQILRDVRASAAARALSPPPLSARPVAQQASKTVKRNFSQTRTSFTKTVLDNAVRAAATFALARSAAARRARRPLARRT